MEEAWIVLAVAGAAALASVAGGVVAMLRRPTTLSLSIALGFAAGVLIATVTLEMVPKALDRTSPGLAAAGFAAGLLAVWALELGLNRGQLAGEHAAQVRRVAHFHRARHLRGDRSTVLAAATAIEEVVEGLAIGSAVALGDEVGLTVALAITIDNFSEGLSIGELATGRHGRGGRRRAWRRVLAWTSAIGVSVFCSALAGWAGLRDAEPGVIGLLLAGGAGGMLYLVVTQLIPTAQERQYEGSSALAIGAGFLLMMLVLAGS